MRIKIMRLSTRKSAINGIIILLGINLFGCAHVSKTNKFCQRYQPYPLHAEAAEEYENLPPMTQTWIADNEHTYTINDCDK